MEEPIHAVLIGAGQRGADVYGEYALRHPEQIRFVAVAEPDPERRERFSARHQVPPERQFSSWEPLLERQVLGQAALVCTQDWQHAEPALAALGVGYHVLLEKPMATTAADCRALVMAGEEAGRQLHICHVLRFTPHFRKMRELVQSGALGQVATVSHRENVSFWHMAHSFVRGNWRRAAEGSPMILAKCCHDLDILPWILGRQCSALSSFGSLIHFRAENAPDGAPERCLDGCPASEHCPFYAPYLYLDMDPIWHSVAETASGATRRVALLRDRSPRLFAALSQIVPALKAYREYRGWPRSVLSIDPTPENLRAALVEGPYGRCVYRCDNDVVDHQVVSMAFEGGISATLTMHGHSAVEGRTTRIDGSLGTLNAHFGPGGAWIEVEQHRSGRKTRFETGSAVGDGHGGGDEALVAAFVKSLRAQGRAGVGDHFQSTAREALESHLMAFAAEQARLEDRVVPRSEWIE